MLVWEVDLAKFGCLKLLFRLNARPGKRVELTIFIINVRPRSNKMLLRLLPLNFATKVPPKVRNRDKADFATKVRKSSINRQNVNHEQL